MRRLPLLLVLGFAAGLVFAACAGTGNTCSAATCGGCCDSKGICQPGVSADACGVGGDTCGRCGTGTTCSAGACSATGSGGGGGAATGGGGGSATGGGGGSATGGGGGSATGGGGGTACRTVATFTTASTAVAFIGWYDFTMGTGNYNVVRWRQAGPTALDVLGLEVVYPNSVGPTAPFTQAITTAGYKTCAVCATFSEGCSGSPLMCGKFFLAQAGTISMTRVDRSDAGRIEGSASNLRFVEWDGDNDRPVANGACIEVTQVGPFSVGWDANGNPLP